MAAGVLGGSISHLLYISGILGVDLIAIGGGLFRREMLPQNSPLAWVLMGWITHLIISSLLGVLISYILYIAGRDFALWKGLLTGVAAWFVGIALIAPLAGYISATAGPADIWALLGYHLLYGVLTAWLLVRYAGSGR